MAKSDYLHVRAALVEDNQQLRGDLRAALNAKGIHSPIVCRSAQSFIDVAGNEMLDLVVCDSNTLGSELTTALQRLRRNDLGGNPFTVVLATAHDASMNGIRTVLDAGVDDLLLKPVSINRIIERIDTLVWDRKPFVVTGGYVGPTRRAAKRSTDNYEITIDAPNTLRGKVVEKMDEKTITQMVHQAVNSLHEKMDQHPLLGIDRLIARTLAYSANGGSADDLKRDFGYLMDIGQQLSTRYRGTAYAHIGELAVALANLARRIANRNPRDLHPGDLEPLSNLGEVIRRSIAAEERATDLAPGAAMAAASGRGPAGGGSAARH